MFLAKAKPYFLINRQAILLLIAGILCLFYFSAVSGCQNHTTSALRVCIIIQPDLLNIKPAIEKAAQKAITSYGRGTFDILIVAAKTVSAYENKMQEYINKYETNKTLIAFVIEGNKDIDLTEVVRKHILTGYPVVLLNFDYPDSRRDAFIDTDPSLEGKLLGKILTDSEPTDRHILLFSDKSYKSTMRLSSLHRELKQYPRIKVIKTITETEPASTKEVLRDCINKYPQLYAIASTTPSIYNAEYKEVLQAFKGKIYATANTKEAISSLVEGRTESLIVPDIYTQIFLATTICLERLEGQIIRKPDKVPPIVLTQDNVDEYSMGYVDKMEIKSQ